MEISLSVEEYAQLQESLGKKDKRIGQLEDEVAQLKSERDAKVRSALLTEREGLLTELAQGWGNGGVIILSAERMREFVSHLGMDQWLVVRALVEHSLPDELRLMERSLVMTAVPLPAEKPLVSIGQAGDVIEAGGMKTIRNMNKNSKGEPLE